MELKPCPCGVTPERLVVTGDHAAPKYARVQGDCCGVWEIEFRNDYKAIEGPESNQSAEAAWNASPRAAQSAGDR